MGTVTSVRHVCTCTYTQATCARVGDSVRRAGGERESFIRKSWKVTPYFLTLLSAVHMLKCMHMHVHIVICMRVYASDPHAHICVV